MTPLRERCFVILDPPAGTHISEIARATAEQFIADGRNTRGFIFNGLVVRIPDRVLWGDADTIAAALEKEYDGQMEEKYGLKS